MALNNSNIPSILTLFLLNSTSSILGSILIGAITIPKYESLIPASERHI